MLTSLQNNQFITVLAATTAPNAGLIRDSGGALLITQDTIFHRKIRLTDINGNPVLSATPIVELAKNNGDFELITPVIVELGDGWYDILFTTEHNDTVGSHTGFVHATGAVSRELYDQVVAPIVIPPFPTNPSGIKKNTALDNYKFSLYTLQGLPFTGTVATVKRMRDVEASFIACDNTPSPLGGGDFTINFTADDLNGDTVFLEFTALGAQRKTITIVTEP